jgi:uncharacterized membrane protein SpoIIM required for sporulation
VSNHEPIPWSVTFRRERQETWRELEDLVKRCERDGLVNMSADKLARLPVLYRATVSALGVARTSLLDQNLRDYLEALVARAYLVVYSPKRAVGQVLREFLIGGFAESVRSIRWHVLVAFLTMMVGGAIAYAMVQADSSSYYMFVDRGLAGGRDPMATTETLRETLFATQDYEGLLTFAVMLFTHNSSVGILAYGLGFALGLPVLLLLLQTGMMLGSMTALFHSRGLAVEWWSWILPHGVTELTAIVLCGAAGLAIGHRVVFPGRSARSVAMADIGRSMGAVIAGSVAMLLVAGVVEGIFRQVVQSISIRYLMAATFAVLWTCYFCMAGRKAR